MWGTFDVESFSDVLSARITRCELLRRLPAAEIVSFAPFGHAHPTRLDGGEPAEPLGRWSSQRLTELAARLHCVVVTGDGLLGMADGVLADHYGIAEDELTARAPLRFFIQGLGELEAACPVMWHGVGGAAQAEEGDGTLDAALLRKALADRAYVALCDGASKQHLEEVGVDCDLVLIPHPAVVASRLFPASLLHKRLEYLRVMGWYPRHDQALVVQGNRGLLPQAVEVASGLERLAEDLGGAAIVLLQANPCDGDEDFADAVAAALRRRPFRVPVAGIEDVMACIAGSAAVVTSSAALAATATSFGRPSGATNEVGRLGQPPTADQLLALQSEVDVSFDRVAGIAEKAAAGRLPPEADNAGLVQVQSTLSALRQANMVQGRRWAAAAVKFADHLSELAAARADAEALVTAHSAVTAAQEGVIAGQRQALEEQQRTLLRLQESVQAQSAELERSAALFGESATYTTALEARVAAAESRQAAAEAELALVRVRRVPRLAARARAAASRLRRLGG